MKSIIKYIIILFTTSIFACGGGEWEGMDFYNLFMQTNISAEEFYPFLKDEYNTFYGEDYYYNEGKKEIFYPKGNVNLWQEILTNWSRKDIENAVYKFASFQWKSKNSSLEKRAKAYLKFANDCSKSFDYRNNSHTWDYEKILKQEPTNFEELLTTASELLSKETNEQLKMRYYYQIIRLFHYGKKWDEAVRFYEDKIEGKLPKNEMYYYILDQVAGCYYSLKQHNKAAYLFTKVLNNGIDRKKSAFLSYNFCTYHNAEGKQFFKGIEDQKDLLLIKSLRSFANETQNINKFIQLDVDDKRIELLFMRALSDIERDVWVKFIGVDSKKLPNYSGTYKKKINAMLQIAMKQSKHAKNKDFWQIASSYISFINRDIPTAKSKLKEVKTFAHQKRVLSKVYEVFSWKIITPENEKYLAKIYKEVPKIKKQNYWDTETMNDWFHLINDKIANTYYKNGELAKTFLIHNSVEVTNNLGSIELLNALTDFYYKANKNEFEKMLVNKTTNYKTNFIDYLNHQKGIYYLQHKNPTLALDYFNKNKSYKGKLSITKTIFSNNIKECFECEDVVMTDEVYKASLFSFIKSDFTRKELATYLLKLEKLTQDETQWKAKLAHYLLGNYYYNISNTGYYRGLLTSNTNCCNSTYTGTSYVDAKPASDIIKNNKGYNLYDIGYYDTYYFDLSTKSRSHYEKTIELSSDKELNARCLFLIAKCELNQFYNNGEEGGFEIKTKYYNYYLPYYESFKILKNDYSDTDFHKMILKECSYFRIYSNR